MSNRFLSIVNAVFSSVIVFWGLLCMQSRPRKSAQGDKWSFCLMTGTLCPANQERP
jgi:hypothetical protein